MVELVFYIWLLGSALVFVGVAMTGEASERTEPLWLLVLSAAWPLVLVICLLGWTVTVIGWLATARR
jgi:cytochrome bd-type quinol oxidase subunit 1